jgi:hypothetical protein
VAVNHVNINYPGAGVARFDGQITVESLPAPPEDKHVRFSRPGDSGSLIVDLSGKSVALLFAGSGSGGQGNVGITIANPWHHLDLD